MSDLRKQVQELKERGSSVRQAARILGISKSKVGRMWDSVGQQWDSGTLNGTLSTPGTSNIKVGEFAAVWKECGFPSLSGAAQYQQLITLAKTRERAIGVLYYAQERGIEKPFGWILAVLKSDWEPVPVEEKHVMIQEELDELWRFDRESRDWTDAADRRRLIREGFEEEQIDEFIRNRRQQHLKDTGQA